MPIGPHEIGNIVIYDIFGIMGHPTVWGKTSYFVDKNTCTFSHICLQDNQLLLHVAFNWPGELGYEGLFKHTMFF